MFYRPVLAKRLMPQSAKVGGIRRAQKMGSSRRRHRRARMPSQIEETFADLCELPSLRLIGTDPILCFDASPYVPRVGEVVDVGAQLDRVVAEVWADLQVRSGGVMALW